MNKDYQLTKTTCLLTKNNKATGNDEKRKKLGHSLEDILFSCTFNNQDCGVDDFIWKFDRYYGNCFVFNSGMNSSGGRVELKKSLIAGSTYGLQLEYYVGFHENLTLFNSIAGKGGYVRIENSSFLNDDSLDGIFLTPGLSPSISIERKLDFYLAKPYSNCDIDTDSPNKFTSEFYRLIYYSVFAYNQQFCFNQCFQKKLIQLCNCSDPQLLSLFNSTSCESNEQQDCMAKIYDQVLLKNNFIGIECVPACPLECNRIEFRASISSAELIGNLNVDFINTKPDISSDFMTKPINPDNSKQSFVSVYLYYDSLAYTLSTETPVMDVVGLLANIGGTLVLFLGISLLHICEIIEVIIEIIFIKTEKKTRASKIEPSLKLQE